MLKKIRSLVSNSDFIEIYDNALSPEDCQRLIKLWQSREKVDGWCYSGKVPVINPEIKKGKELERCNLNDPDPINLILKPVVESCIDKYVEKYSELDKYCSSWDVDGEYTFKKFEGEDEGFKVWHCEACPGATDRILVWSFYLNDAESGTEFLQYPTIRAKLGRCVVWPSGWTHMHRSQIPNKGVKYYISGWASYANRK